MGCERQAALYVSGSGGWTSGGCEDCGARPATTRASNAAQAPSSTGCRSAGSNAPPKASSRQNELSAPGRQPGVKRAGRLTGLHQPGSHPARSPMYYCIGGLATPLVPASRHQRLRHQVATASWRRSGRLRPTCSSRSVTGRPGRRRAGRRVPACRAHAAQPPAARPWTRNGRTGRRCLHPRPRLCSPPLACRHSRAPRKRRPPPPAVAPESRSGHADMAHGVDQKYLHLIRQWLPGPPGRAASAVRWSSSTASAHSAEVCLGSRRRRPAARRAAPGAGPPDPSESPRRAGCPPAPRTRFAPRAAPAAVGRRRPLLGGSPRDHRRLRLEGQVDQGVLVPLGVAAAAVQRRRSAGPSP